MVKTDVIVIGGGHAGVEASLACAKRNLKVILFTLDISHISNMPCNPSIGGSAKGIVVREIDALGGFMGIAADHSYLQMKMLNTSKGPGVQCLRAQEDKYNYPHYIQETLLKTPNLKIIEKEVKEVLFSKDKVTGVIDEDKKEYSCKALILTTGTYMNSLIYRGEKAEKAGPDGQHGSYGLSTSLKKAGFNIIRLKTGTPPRIEKSSIDFSKCAKECGTDKELCFSYTTNNFKPFKDQILCHLIYTNKKTHEIIKSNLKNSSQFNGLITSVGPRYCPSIEGKIMTFKDKERHQLFLEPEYENGESIYLQGFSTSMAPEIQEKMVHSLQGLEHAKILKYAYAIEYDSLDPLEFNLNLESRLYKNFFGAGQILGTSGYEEAAALGLMAGINASNSIQKKEPFILKRSEAYIGVMIDDIMTKGITEPYRLLSSRAEYRLLLRHDNADLRLTDYGHEIGLIDDKRYKEFLEKNKVIKSVYEYLNMTTVSPKSLLNKYLKKVGYANMESGQTLASIVKRPNVEFKEVINFDDNLKTKKLSDIEVMQIEILVKYEGYIKKQISEAERLKKYEDIKLDTEIDYSKIDGLALEARQKLNKVKPNNIGQASRISGINPSDISMLIIWLKKRNTKK